MDGRAQRDRRGAPQAAPRAAGERSRPDRRSPVLLVEVADEEVGLSLIDHLSRFHTELAPMRRGCAVRVELPDRAALPRVLDRVSRWLAVAGAGSARVRFREGRYTITAIAEAARPSPPPIGRPAKFPHG